MGAPSFFTDCLRSLLALAINHGRNVLGCPNIGEVRNSQRDVPDPPDRAFVVAVWETAANSQLELADHAHRVDGHGGWRAEEHHRGFADFGIEQIKVDLKRAGVSDAKAHLHMREVQTFEVFGQTTGEDQQVAESLVQFDCGRGWDFVDFDRQWAAPVVVLGLKRGVFHSFPVLK